MVDVKYLALVVNKKESPTFWLDNLFRLSFFVGVVASLTNRMLRAWLGSFESAEWPNLSGKQWSRQEKANNNYYIISKTLQYSIKIQLLLEKKNALSGPRDIPVQQCTANPGYITSLYIHIYIYICRMRLTVRKINWTVRLLRSVAPTPKLRITSQRTSFAFQILQRF